MRSRVRLERFVNEHRPRRDNRGRFQRTLRQRWVPQSDWLTDAQLSAYLQVAPLEYAALYRLASEGTPWPGLLPTTQEFIYAGEHDGQRKLITPTAPRQTFAELADQYFRFRPY